MLEMVMVIIIVGPAVAALIGAFIDSGGGPAYTETPEERAFTTQVLQFTGLVIVAFVLLGLIFYIAGPARM